MEIKCPESATQLIKWLWQGMKDALSWQTAPMYLFI